MPIESLRCLILLMFDVDFKRDFCSKAPNAFEFSPFRTRQEKERPSLVLRTPHPLPLPEVKSITEQRMSCTK